MHVSGEPPYRQLIQSAADVRQWVDATEQELASGRRVVATFIIDIEGHLWIADRHSEHVQCARGNPVLSAGEITFTLEINMVDVACVTNQSTGYCPEPDSWDAVASALARAGFSYPPEFSLAFLFRKCVDCATTNIVKEDRYECDVCGQILPAHWNFEG